MLYAWCRHCDDRIDAQDHGHRAPGQDLGDAKGRWLALEDETRRALDGDPMTDPAFIALQRVVSAHGIPRRHPLDLLRGFAMDVEGRHYRTLDDTLDYCYHVAGVVGVMMAMVMNARSSEALDRAADLGIAFQLTNIARDVCDDARVGRVYLPSDWLDEAGVPAGAILQAGHRAAVASVVARLLGEADRYYDSSLAGLAALDFRCAWSIAAARRVYREIGQVVKRRGASAWDTRATVGNGSKTVLGLAAAGDALGARVAERTKSRDGLWTRPQA